MTEHTIPAPAQPTAAHARRLTTRALKKTADLIDTLSVVSVAALALAAFTGIGPQWAQLSLFHLVVAAFALYGLACCAWAVLEGIADAIDPDATDGAAAHHAAATLAQISRDLGGGAHAPDVLDNLQTSRLLPELHTTLVTLAVTCAEEGRHETARRLYDAAGHLNHADRSLAAPQR